MFINSIEGSFPVDPVLEKLTGTLRWVGVSIAKVTGVALAIIFLYALISVVFGKERDKREPDEFICSCRTILGNIIKTIIFFGVCKGIGDIFFFCILGNLQYYIPKPIVQAIPLS